MELKKLIQACKRNDKKAQRELYVRYKNVLYNLSLKYCRNVTEAEDNLHDSFLDIFKNIKTFKAHGSFDGWVKRITINNAITRYKSFKPNLYSELGNYSRDVVEVESEVLNKVPLNIILSLIQELPSQYRLVFNLYELDGFSHQEIAAMLTISEGSSRSNLHRAKKLLKAKVEAYVNKRQKQKNYG